MFPYEILDVFSTTRYAGNPVACILIPEDSLTKAQKQAIAAEFNLSEVVFIHGAQQTQGHAGDGEFSQPGTDIKIDIFTAYAEVPFAGHPTIGTANYVLKHRRECFPFAQALVTKAGRIPISLESSSGTTLAKAKIPHDLHIHQNPYSVTLASQASDPGPHSCPIVSIVKGMSFILIGVPDLATLKLASVTKSIVPNVYDALELLDEGPYRVGIVPAYYFVDVAYEDQCGDERSREGVNWGYEGKTRHIRTRMFGSREDPATGSAASALCCYLSLQQERKKTAAASAVSGIPTTYLYRIEQGVEMARRSEIFLEVVTQGDGIEIEQVFLSGAAVAVMRGALHVPDADYGKGKN